MSRQARIESTKAARAGSHMVQREDVDVGHREHGEDAAERDEQQGETGAGQRVHGLRADGVVGGHQRRVVNGWGRRTIQRSSDLQPAAKAPKKAAPGTSADQSGSDAGDG